MERDEAQARTKTAQKRPSGRIVFIVQATFVLLAHGHSRRPGAEHPALPCPVKRGEGGDGGGYGMTAMLVKVTELRVLVAPEATARPI